MPRRRPDTNNKRFYITVHGFIGQDIAEWTKVSHLRVVVAQCLGHSRIVDAYLNLDGNSKVLFEMLRHRGVFLDFNIRRFIRRQRDC